MGLDAPIALGDLCLSLPRTPKRSRIGLGTTRRPRRRRRLTPAGATG
ncbi:hypothetical protein BZL30_0059 [Mycobacterium kansasii]|uniref:Uncharacterized protein n=1 Tax=Mycobacterium kansasii TaxID=1768 RepID=A0A1V3XT99_MYCKA|nr:hypothetical protein BZL30_0059 [Mycobacterium kansasii]